MRRNTRFIFVAVLAGLACVAGASLTWACTPSGFGTPATPPPPADGATPGTSAPVASPPPSTEAAAPVAVNVNPSSPSSAPSTESSGVTSGATVRTTGRSRNSEAVARTPGATSRVGVTSSFSQRAAGVTAGTTSRGGRPVFARPAPPAEAEKSSRDRAAATAPSTRSAAGDLWTGFEPAARSSLLAAEASARPEGVNGTVAAALAALALGFFGIAGATGIVALRRRRVKAGPSSPR